MFSENAGRPLELCLYNAVKLLTSRVYCARFRVRPHVQASTSQEWQSLEAKCKARGLSDAAIAAFKSNYTQLEQGATGLVRHTKSEKEEARRRKEKEEEALRRLRKPLSIAPRSMLRDFKGWKQGRTF